MDQTEASGSPPRRRPRLTSPSPEAGEPPPPSIDSLPPEILESILVRLPVRDFVRSSALSRSWRRLWESTPGFKFYWHYHDEHPDAAVSVLSRYACPVLGFRHWSIPKERFAQTDEWIVLLAAKRVQSLTLRFGEYIDVDFHTLHSDVFSCRELTDLCLERCNLPEAPSGFAGFPNLTKLSLHMVGLANHGEKTLEVMIASAPLLDLLELKEVWINVEEIDEWVIHAPKLKSLTIESDGDYFWEIEELPSIETVTLKVNEEYIDRDFVQLLTCFSQVSRLEFRMPPTDDNALEGLTCCFHNLKDLTLDTEFCNLCSILSIFSLLRSCPNLEILEIENVGIHIQNDEVDVDFLNTLWTENLFSKLDDVTLKNAPCLSNDMHFIEFVLSKARLLRKFLIYRDDISSYSKPSEAAVIELAKYRRVSPKAKVLFRNMEDFYI